MQNKMTKYTALIDTFVEYMLNISQNRGWIYASMNDSMQISALLAITILLDYKLIVNLFLSRK